MRLVHGSFALIFATALGLAVACGGGTPPPETGGTEPQPSAEPAPSDTAPAPTASEATPEPAPTTSASAEPAAPAKPAWDDMSPEQRAELMKTVVIPQVGGLFKEFDGKKYADVKCALCHGANAKEVKFKMPNPKLPKLDPADHFAKHMKKNEKMTKFMMDKVLPAMAKALGMEPWNPETKSGFGCAGCHTMVEMKAPAAKPAGKKG